VETELQLAFLRHHTCDEVQGYLLAQPTSAIEIERAFTSHAALSHKLIVYLFDEDAKVQPAAPSRPTGRLAGRAR